jgi:hypothetical protein
MKTLKILFAAVILLVSYTAIAQNPVDIKCRTGLNRIIPQSIPIRDSILVTLGSSCEVLDVNLRIDTILHTWISDLNIYLRKGNAGAKVFNRSGGAGDNIIRCILNDSALTSIDNGTAPFTGSYRPHQPLTVFNSIPNYDGYWVLTIIDTAGGDTGIFNAWCLEIEYWCWLGGIQTVEIPNTYRLYQNYPNPFNPVSKIKYGVPKNGYVKLAVYDEIGRLVAILQDGEKQANTYEAEFDATNLPSGVYYYRLEAEGFSETKKMVVLK